MTGFLEASVVVRRPQHTLDARLCAERGDLVAVIGPNGAGKSTLLRALAGLVPLDDGTITCDGTPWEGPGTRLRTQDRNVGMVFQEQLLFPHLSARGNVAFGPRSRGAGRRAAHHHRGLQEPGHRATCSNQRSRSSASTATDTSSRITLTTIAAPWSLCRSV